MPSITGHDILSPRAGADALINGDPAGIGKQDWLAGRAADGPIRSCHRAGDSTFNKQDYMRTLMGAGWYSLVLGRAILADRGG